MEINKCACRIGLCAITIFLLSANVYSRLPVVRKTQAFNNWCWAASCEMVLDYYKISWNQSAIANWAVSGQNVDNYLCGDSYPGHSNWHTCEEVYAEENIFPDACKAYSMGITDDEPAYGDFYEQIHNCSAPVHAVISFMEGPHHVVFVDAKTEGGTKKLEYIEPDGMKNAYDVLEGHEISWIEAAMLFGKDVGIYDEIQIVKQSGYNPEYIHPNEQVHFKCYWHDVNQTSWITEIIWDISFDYNGGQYSYATNHWHQQNLWQRGYVYWHPTIPSSLPSGKYWYGTESGGDVYVKGTFRIDVKDSDGYWHSDTKPLWFKNPGVPLIPWNASFENETVAQGGIVVLKARNKISIDNVNFNPNSHGNFISGNTIDIAPNTGYSIFDNGAEINFTVDPSLQ